MDYKGQNQNWDGKYYQGALKTIFKFGSAAALIAILVGVTEILITFLPGGNTVQETVFDWFDLFQKNWFMGLRDLGLMNILLTLTGLPILLALFFALRRSDMAALALVIGITGAAVFLATNRAFPMVALSNQYAAATAENERAIISSAGVAMLSVGQSHTAGTFLGFFLSEAASILFSVVMLREKIFNRLTAISGLCGFSLLLIFEFCSSFFTGVTPMALAFAMTGGILSMGWYALLCVQLNRLGRDD